jgi:hypothetical protein
LGSESLNRKIFQSKNFHRAPFDRNTICPNTVWPNTIWPKGHLTETPFVRTPFDRMPFDRKFIWPNCRIAVAWRRRRQLGNQTLFWSDADSKIRIAFPIQMMNQGCFTFYQKLFRSNDLFSKKTTFGQMTIFQKSFRSNELSVKCHFGYLTSFSNLIFDHFPNTIFQILSVKRPFNQFCFRPNAFFGKINFRSNGIQLKGDSVKWNEMKWNEMIFR